MKPVQEEVAEIRKLFGTGADTHALLGKTVEALVTLKSSYSAGDTGKAVFVSREGSVWVDFGKPDAYGFCVHAVDPTECKIIA